jgi:PAS domain S-box-containing protein
MVSVLCVDDEPAFLDIVKLFLERTGIFTVDTADSAFTALEKLRKKSYDAIVSDYQMPGMDGIEFLKRVRASYPHIPFIIFTGKGREEIAVKAFEHGADSYSQKGGEAKAQFAELAHKIQRAVSARRAEIAVQKYQVQLANAMDLAQIVNWEFDVATGLFSFNDRFYALYGTTAEREGGTTMPAEVYVRKFVHPDDIPAVTRVIRDVLAITDPDSFQQGEHRILRRDGQVRDIVVRFAVVMDPSGKVVRTYGVNQDITERKRMEEIVRTERDFAESIVNTAQTIVLVLDPGGRILRFNPFMEEISGYRLEDVQGKDWFSTFVPERDRDQVRTIFSDALTGNQTRGVVNSIVTRAGQEREIRWYSTTLRDSRGTITGLLSTGQDITDYRKAERELKASELTYRGLFNTIGQAIFIHDMDARIIDVNDGALALFGYSREEFIGKAPEFLLAPGRGDYRAVMDTARRACSGEPQQMEMWAGRKNGEVFPNDVRFYRGVYFGKDVLISIVTDITEWKHAEEALRESEERYRGVVEDQTELICRFAPDGTLTFVNDAYCRYFGLGREGCIGRPHNVALPRDDALRMKRHLEGLTRDNPAGVIEHRIVMPSGEVRWQRWSDRAIFDTSGSIIEYQSVGRDTTEEKRAEEALRERENKYRTIFSTTGTAMVVIEEDGTISLANEEFAHLCGYSRAEIEGKKKWTEFVVAEDLNRMLAQHRLRREDPGRALTHYEFNFVTKSGDIRAISLTIDMIPGTTQSVASLLDVTGYKNAEQELRESEENYRTLVEHLPDGIYILDCQGTFRFVNNEIVRRSGYPAEWFKERTYLEVITPEYHERARNFFAMVMEGKEPPVYEVAYPTASGKLFHAELKTTPVFKNNTVIGLLGISRDINGRKEAEEAIRQSEEKFRTLMENVPDLVLVHRNETILYVNPAMVQTLGYEPDEFYNTSILHYVVPEHHERVLAAIDQRMTGRQEHSYEIGIVPKHGERRTVVVRGTVIEFGGAPAVLNVLTDITDRTRTEEALQRANRQLTLLTTVTRHDIQNQLMVLKGYLELSRDSMDQPDTLSRYLDAEELVVDTIEQQIMFTREYQELGASDPGWQNVHAHLLDAVSRLPMHGVRLEADHKDLEIFADPLLGKVFYNLIDNALSHGGNAMRTIRVSSQESGAGLVIVFEDDGTGIPDKEKEKIFLRGFGEHTGLGLFLAREILSITGITIIEHGVPGKGARFEITVPRGGYRIGTGE